MAHPAGQQAVPAPSAVAAVGDASRAGCCPAACNTPLSRHAKKNPMTTLQDRLRTLSPEVLRGMRRP